MTLLIDPPAWPAHGKLWSHLASDESFAELHAFAAGLGVPERGFEGDHYDVPEDWYRTVVEAGAVPVSCRELLHRLKASGLRRQKRRGEVVITSASLADGGRVDTIVSTQSPRRRPAGLLLVATGPDAGQVLCLPGAAIPAAALPLEPPLERLLAGLVASVLRRAEATAARQIGYLRALGPGPDDVRIDVVVALASSWHEPLPPARWVTAEAVSAARPALAPLISLALRSAAG
jgi:hypothetical protein